MQQDTFSLTFNANPIQDKFIRSRAMADLFASRVGEGKSAGLAWSIFYHTRHNPGADWAVIRDTYENLQKTTLQEFFHWFPPGIAGHYHQTKKLWTWAEGVAKGTVSFIGMDNPEDATKLLSWTLAGIAMDEPAPAVGSGGINEMVFDLGLTRLRQADMKWYGMKLATNNPDENHWTYRKFVSPGNPAFKYYQPTTPENVHNLPDGYYEKVRMSLAHRPDLVRRFVDGEFGYQQEGKAVTPQWSDKMNLATGLYAIPRRELILLWDWGLNPTCIITQLSPLGNWNILYSFVGDGIGVQELIEYNVAPLIHTKFRLAPLRHIGDPQGIQREQSSSQNSAVRVVKQFLPGPWRPGPQKWLPRIEPLRAALGRVSNNRGLIQVDRENAKEVWHALRGGWHYHVAKTGVTSGEPVKDINSHPGDAMSYGAAILFPLKAIDPRLAGLRSPPTPGFFSGSAGGAMPPEGWRIGPDHKGPIPRHGALLK